jgi:PRC-barrel domain protein
MNWSPISRDRLTEAMMQTKLTPLEPHNLIASDRVEGTPVRSTDGTAMGTIKRVMIDKRTGNIAYSVLSLSSAGMARRHLPIPWARLTYDPNLAAYHLDLTETELSARCHESEIDWGDRGREHHYESRVYWGIAETW